MTSVSVKKIIGAGLVVLFSVSVLQGCLKTRAQLRGESVADHQGDSTGEGGERLTTRVLASEGPPQDVKPHGEYVIEELKDEFTRLQGRIEDLERQEKDFERAPSREQSGDLFRRLEARISQLEKGQQAIQDILHELRESVPQSHEALVARQETSDLFTESKNLFAEKKYQEAADQLGKYQKLPKAKNLEEAAFLRGESFFRLKQFKKAVVEYSKFPEKYTRSAHCPEALFKIGLSFDAMGMKEDAKGFYQELVEKFPKSILAKSARKRLK